jgi:Eukaryotic-type carbonic anhydrase
MGQGQLGPQRAERDLVADDENSPEPDAPDANAPITDPDAASEAPDAGAARPTPLEIVQKIPVTKAVDGARSLAANPDARRFVAGALVGALALWAGGIVFRGDDAGNGSASEAKVEALRADLAELRADLAELRAAGGSAASHSETTDAHTDATHTDTTDAGHGDDGHGTTDDTHAADEPPHWTYSEADAWGEIADEYIECAEGQEQSPIDLSTEWEEVPSTSDFEYDAVPVTVTDNGHTIQVSAEGAGTVSQEHHDYELVQFHFHAPSEHTIDGEHHDSRWSV